MFEGDSAETCTGKFQLMLMGGRAEGLACAYPGARTHIGVSGNTNNMVLILTASQKWPTVVLLTPIVN